MRLRLTPTVLKEIKKALDYIDEHSPQGAENVRQRINTALDALLSFPHIGQETNRRGVRRAALTPYPYAIFYRVRADEIVVVRFRHTARRPTR